MANSPSIAVIPSGYKANKIYSVLPTDGSADLTSSRASSATRVNKNGLIEDVATGIPRLDYTNGGCPELLLEPQSTNLIDYSEEFDNAVWNLTRATITPNTTTSPTGDLTADSLVISDNSSQSYFFDGFTLTQNETYTFSVFFKLGDYSGEISIIDFTEGGSVSVNTTTLSQTTSGVFSSSKLENYGNGWYRFSGVFTATIATGNHNVGVSLDATLGSIGESTYFWGAQLEELSYSTSYIRTNGSAVTRIADAVTGNSSLGQVINSSEGVLYAEMSALADDLTFRSLSINNGSNSVLVELRYRTTTNRINFLIKDGVNPDVNEVYVMSDITDNAKFAVKYKSGDIAFWVNGTEVFAGTNTISLSALDTLSFNNDGTSNNPFYGRVKELKVYDTALTDAQLQTLTTL